MFLRKRTFFRYILQAAVRTTRASNEPPHFHALNLISDHRGHLWIIDGQNAQVYDLDKPADVEQLDKKYSPVHLARAVTGMFRPTKL